MIKIKNFIGKSKNRSKQGTYRDNEDDSITNSENSVMRINRNSKEVQNICTPISSPTKSDIKSDLKIIDYYNNAINDKQHHFQVSIITLQDF